MRFLTLPSAGYLSRLLGVVHQAMAVYAARIGELPSSTQDLREHLQSPELRGMLGAYGNLFLSAISALNFFEQVAPEILRVIEIFLQELTRGAMSTVYEGELSKLELYFIRKKYGVKPLTLHSLSPWKFLSYITLYGFSASKAWLHLFAPSLKRILLLKVNSTSFRKMLSAVKLLNGKAILLKGGFNILPHFCRIIRRSGGKFYSISKRALEPSSLLRNACKCLYADRHTASKIIRDDVPIDLTLTVVSPASDYCPALPFISEIIIKDEISIGNKLTVEIAQNQVTGYLHPNAYVDGKLLYMKNLNCLALMLKPIGMKHVILSAIAQVACPDSSTIKFNSHFPLIRSSLKAKASHEKGFKTVKVSNLDIELFFMDGELISANVMNRRKGMWVLIPKEKAVPSLHRYDFLNKAQKRFLLKMGFRLE